MFQNALDTDSVGTSFFFLRPVHETTRPLLTLDDFEPADLRSCRFWGVDPGVTDVFVASDGCSALSGIYNNQLRPNLPPLPPSNNCRVRSTSVRIPRPSIQSAGRNPTVKSGRRRSASSPRSTRWPQTRTSSAESHEIRQFSAAEYDTIAGLIKTKQKIKQYKADSADANGITITNVESTLATAKTARVARANQHVQAVLAALPRLLEFYGHHHQELRFMNYVGRQRATSEMVAIFCNGGKKYTRPNERKRPAMRQDR